MATALLLAVIVVITSAKGIGLFTPIVAERQEELSMSLEKVQGITLECYDCKVVYGVDIFTAINRFEDSDMGILVRLNNVDDYTGEARLHYITPIEIGNEGSDDEYMDYINDNSVTLTTKRFGGFSTTYDSRKFLARLVKDVNGTTRGIYFEEEE